MNVSVLIPCYNEGNNRLAETIFSAYHAGCTDIVVVDDGSAAIPLLPSISGLRYVRQDHKGIASAVNRAACEAKYDWLSWLSVGDTMYVSKLIQQLNWIEDAGEACFHDYYDLVDGAVVKAKENWRERVWYDNQFCCGTMMVSRRAFFDVGGLCEDLQYCIDWRFAMDVERAHGWLHLPEILASCGQHPGGHSDKTRREGPQKRIKQVDRRQVALKAQQYRQELHK